MTKELGSKNNEWYHSNFHFEFIRNVLQRHSLFTIQTSIFSLYFISSSVPYSSVHLFLLAWWESNPQPED